MDFNVYSFLIDFMFASGFILLGQLMRAKVKFFQQFFVPASLIGGFIALIFGANGFDIIPFSGQLGSYSGALIILVFVSVGLNGFNISTKGFKTDVERIGSYACYKEISYAMQYSLPIVLSLVLLSKLHPGLHDGFGMMLGAGFVGGHGTAAAIGATFAKYGWVDATDLGMTTATIGILTGIFGGIIYIKWATKKGITSYITDYAALSDELKTGMIPEDKRVCVGQETVSPMSIDPIAWHLAILLVPSGLGHLAAKLISSKWNLEVPSFTLGFLIAVAFYYLLKTMGAIKYVDKKMINRLGSAATDYLVFFGVASIKVPIIMKYALPLVLLSLLGLIIVIFGLRYFGPRMMKENWFERGMFCFGYLTGVFAIGFTLLRIVDPDLKSKTLDDTAIINPFTSFMDMAVISTGPILCATGKAWSLIGWMGAYFIIMYAIARVAKWWYPKLPLDRDGYIKNKNIEIGV